MALNSSRIFECRSPMEEGDKSIVVGRETSLRVSAGSPSWLCGSRQRFTIELRPGGTTIVSWKRLVKDAQNMSHLSARKTEDFLDECFQDNKPTVKQNGLLVNSEKLKFINEPLFLEAQQSRKRSKNMAKGHGGNIDDHVPSKHAKVEEGRLNFAATNALLEEQSPALSQNLAANNKSNRKLHNLLSSPVRSSARKPVDAGTKSEHHSDTGISNNDALISPLNSEDSDKHRNITIHSRDIGNNTSSVATHQKHLEKGSCKHESPLRKLTMDNDEVGISTSVEHREKMATCGELPDLNLPVYPVQPEAKRKKLEKAIRELEKVVAESRLATMEAQDVDGSSAAIKRRSPYEVKQKLAKVAILARAELWPNGIMNKHGIKSVIHRAKERRRALCSYDTVRGDRRKKSAHEMEAGIRGAASSISQLQVVPERHSSESGSHILALSCRAVSGKETMYQHIAAPLEISCVSPKCSSVDISNKEKIEKMTIRCQMKQQQRELKNRVKKLSLKLEKESR